MSYDIIDSCIMMNEGRVRSNIPNWRRTNLRQRMNTLKKQGVVSTYKGVRDQERARLMSSITKRKSRG